MQISKLELNGEVVETYKGYDIIARDWSPREGIFFRYFFVQSNGVKSSCAYQSIANAKAQCTKLAKAGKEKHNYMA